MKLLWISTVLPNSPENRVYTFLSKELQGKLPSALLEVLRLGSNQDPSAKHRTSPEGSRGVSLSDIWVFVSISVRGKLPCAAFRGKSPRGFGAAACFGCKMRGCGSAVRGSPSKTSASQERCHVETPVQGRIIYRPLILCVEHRQKFLTLLK